MRQRAERRRGRGARWEIVDVAGEAIPVLEDGRPGVVTSTVDDVLAAIQRLDDVSWETFRPLVRPIFHRRRPFSFTTPEAVTRLVPPGVSIGFAADIGPALVHVHTEMLRRWNMSADELAAVAEANLREAAAGHPPASLVRERVEGYEAVAFQSHAGWASTLLLVPDLIETIFGAGDRLLVAPMRDLLIGLPSNVDRGLASWLTAEFEALDPNALCLEAFLWQAGRLTIVPLEREVVSA